MTIITIKQIVILYDYQYILFVYSMYYDTTIDQPVYQGNSVNSERRTVNITSTLNPFLCAADFFTVR